MIEILVAYNVNTLSTELIRSEASVNVSAGNVSVKISFRSFLTRGGGRVNARPKLPKVHFDNNDYMPFSYRVTSDRSEDRLQRLIYSFAYLNRLPSNNFVEYTSDIHEFRRIIYENILFLFHFRYTIMRDYFKFPNKPFPSPKSSHFQNEAKCKHYFCANAIFFFA